MNRYLLFFLSLALAICFAACGTSETTTFDISGAARIELRSGLNGNYAEITGKDDIEYITNNINALALSRMTANRAENGWAYSLKWYDAEDNIIESLTIISETQINKGEYSYYCADSNYIDTEFLSVFLNSVD